MNPITQEEHDLVGEFGLLLDSNPFEAPRQRFEKRILGPAFVDDDPIGLDPDAAPGTVPVDANAEQLAEVAERLAAKLRTQLVPKARCELELRGYYRLVLYVLFERYAADWAALLVPPAGLGCQRALQHWQRVNAYARFARDVAHFFAAMPAHSAGYPLDPAELFAVGFQQHRANYHVCYAIRGNAPDVVELRAAASNAIFSHLCRRKHGTPADYINDTPILVTGALGTIKKDVARAIALSGYIPFDAQAQSFAADPAAAFHAVDLAALRPSDVESALFGHCRGAFAAADQDRAGAFEACGTYGVLYLDNIERLDAEMQYTVMRALMRRRFARCGESEERRFRGKLIAATTCDLETEVVAGRFREDFFQFLRDDDSLTMPTLRKQLDDTEWDLFYLARCLARDELDMGHWDERRAEEADELATNVEVWVQDRLPYKYAWPANMRQLEVCVRSIRHEGEYWPDPDMWGPVRKCSG